MGCKILVINALRRQAHVSHFTLQEALDLIAELKPEKAYLTHISHQLGKHSNIEKELPSGVFQAYDSKIYAVFDLLMVCNSDDLHS